jgi:hypothetical protein
MQLQRVQLVGALAKVKCTGQGCLGGTEVLADMSEKRAEDEGFEPSRLSSTRVRDARTRPLCESSRARLSLVFDGEPAIRPCSLS